jgi:hypothetical protein
MAKVTAFTIVRNEDILIAHTMIHLASLADEVVVVVQPSSDATLMIAKDCADKLPVPCKVAHDRPEKFGWEYSLVHASDLCSHDWAFALNADECFVGASLGVFADIAQSHGVEAVAFPRWHAVAVDAERWFKVEQWCPRVRLFRRDKLRKIDVGIHHGLEHMFSGQISKVPAESGQGRIIEYKAPWHHYRAQLFYDSTGDMNERQKCESSMSPLDLKIGQAFWERMRAEPTNP